MKIPPFYFKVSSSDISVTYKGKTYTLHEEDEDRFEELVELLKRTDQDPSEENIKSLLKVFDPMYVVSTWGNLKKHRSGKYYLEGVSVPLPQAMAEKYVEYIEKGLSIEALENFWKLLVLNPDKHVRESLFKFADRYNFPITRDGHFVAYKSVAWGAEKYREFAIEVNSTINHMKTTGHGNSHLDSPVFIYYTENKLEDAMRITEEGIQDRVKGLSEKYPDFPLSENTVENFKSLYQLDSQSTRWEEADQSQFDVATINEGLKNKTLRFTQNGLEALIVEEGPEMTVLTIEEAFEKVQELMEIEGLEFTDHHTRTMEIRIGTAVTMPREECDNDPQRTCSSGLHVGAPEYVKDFGHSERFVLACLINPMNVVAIPSDYNHTKMRVCEYYPFALAKIKDEKIEELDQEIAVENYKELDLQNIEERLKEIQELKDSELTAEEAAAILETRRIQI